MSELTKKVDPQSPLASTAVALAAARDAEAAWKGEIEKATAEFNKAHEEKFRLHRAAKENVAAIEANLRALIVSSFAQDQDKEPLPGLKVREEEKVSLVYNPTEARKWCLEKGMFLEMNREAFEGMALSSPDSVPFVQVSTAKEPKATIAKDLAPTLAAIEAAKAAAEVV